VTVQNSASSTLTLEIMLGVVLAFLPVVIAYQTWVYIRFGGAVTKESIEDGPAY
jgi:cytochrome d ubiquinol oxidase subunit II